MCGKYRFLYVDIQFDVPKVGKFVYIKIAVKMLVMFSPIFVVEKKIIKKYF